MPATLTKSEFEAARFLIARLRAEAAGEVFDAAAAGYTWNPSANPIVMVSHSDSTVVRAGDVIRASLIMMWSFVLEAAISESPQEFIGRMGVLLAAAEPEDGD